MNKVKKTVGINLAILLAYTIIAGLVSLNETGQYKGLGAMMLMAFGLVLHVGISLLVSIIFFATRDKEKGRAFLLSSLLVLVVGFSTCIGIGSIV